MVIINCASMVIINCAYLIQSQHHNGHHQLCLSHSVPTPQWSSSIVLISISPNTTMVIINCASMVIISCAYLIQSQHCNGHHQLCLSHSVPTPWWSSSIVLQWSSSVVLISFSPNITMVIINCASMVIISCAYLIQSQHHEVIINCAHLIQSQNHNGHHQLTLAHSAPAPQKVQ